MLGVDGAFVAVAGVRTCCGNGLVLFYQYLGQLTSIPGYLNPSSRTEILHLIDNAKVSAQPVVCVNKKKGCVASLGHGLAGALHPVTKVKTVQQIAVNTFILESSPAAGAADPGTRRCHQSLRLQHQAGVEGWRRSHPQGPHPRHRLRLLHPRRLLSLGRPENG